MSCGRRGCAKKLRCASFSARALLFLILPILAPPIHLNVDISCTLHCCRPVQLKSKKAGWVVFDSLQIASFKLFSSRFLLVLEVLPKYFPALNFAVTNDRPRRRGEEARHVLHGPASLWF